MNLTIDFETRSRSDLKKTGPWVYGSHSSTQVLCLSVKVDNEPSCLWLPSFTYGWLPMGHGLPIMTADRLVELVEQAETVSAFNAEFEQAIWHHVMVRRHAFPEIPLNKWRCSAARAAMCALPRSLGEACSVLGLATQKDMEGKRTMLKMCKPQKTRARKTRTVVGRRLPTKWELPEQDGLVPDVAEVTHGTPTEYWHEDPADFVKLCRYCLQDTDAEHDLSRALPPLPPNELAIWRLDQLINRRGLLVDVPAAQAMVRAIADYEAKLLVEFRGITQGKLSSPKQVQALLEYLKTEFGVELEDLKKNTVVGALEDIAEEAEEGS